VRLGVLRPIEEPLRQLVRDVDLWKPEEEPHVPPSEGQRQVCPPDVI
jgi:hypothetical protein